MTGRARTEPVPAGYDPSEFPAFAVTVDVVILTMADGQLQVLLVRRGVAPFEGMWAIPGGFKRPNETLDEAATRELVEETGVDGAALLNQFGAYGDPGRDPRMNVVTVAYLAVLRDLGDVVAGTDAAHAGLVPVADALDGKLELAFDHARIVRDAVERVRVDLELRGIATAFVGSTFTLAELRAVYEAVWGVHLDGANFRRSILAEDGMGDPDRTARASGRDRRQAGGAVPRRAHVAAGGRADPLPAVERETEGQEVRAVVHDRYGPPEVLRIGDVARPVPGDEEILVRVRATTVNRTDCGWRSGSPFFVRYFTGIRRPKWRTLGMEFAGEVEAVGSVVTEFAVGDRVFGVQGHGANAEFVNVRASRRRLPHARRDVLRRGCRHLRRRVHRALVLQEGRPARGPERRRLRRFGLGGDGGRAARPPLRRARDRRLQHEERRARPLARRRRGDRLRARGLHEERQDVRRDLRCGRQALVPALPTAR